MRTSFCANYFLIINYLLPAALLKALWVFTSKHPLPSTKMKLNLWRSLSCLTNLNSSQKNCQCGHQVGKFRVGEEAAVLERTSIYKGQPPRSLALCANPVPLPKAIQGRMPWVTAEVRVGTDGCVWEVKCSSPFSAAGKTKPVQSTYFHCFLHHVNFQNVRHDWKLRLYVK